MCCKRNQSTSSSCQTRRHCRREQGRQGIFAKLFNCGQHSTAPGSVQPTKEAHVDWDGEKKFEDEKYHDFLAQASNEQTVLSYKDADAA